jgi:hypothetical protein
MNAARASISNCAMRPESDAVADLSSTGIVDSCRCIESRPSMDADERSIK